MEKKNNPMMCPECGSPYFKCFICGYIYCECEGTSDSCPECESTDIGFADMNDLGESDILYEDDEFYEEDE
ncbi:MAG: hypothetical protein NC926_05285 [Candidatus Omnitrophica bacterium]|nr:hypothetical protein [Candidatus Omnitrophota bacterium]MCM8807350.1 hypothetical protein [Candidatus Omnitrophota bacterium]